MLQPAPRELVAEGPQQQMRIGSGHDLAMAPTLVLVHGFTHTSASWDPVVSALGERYRAVAPDLRGHGSASDVETVTLATVIEDLYDLVGDAATIAGYSMGGRLALHVALAHPERVARLVLIGASPGLEDRTERAARMAADQQLAKKLEQAGVEAFARRWARTPVLAGLTPALAQRVHEDRLRSSAAGLASALRGLGTGALPSLWERLGEVRMPVDLVVGERDGKFRATAERMAERLPHGRVTVVPGAGHAVHLEAPEQVAEVIAAG